MKGWGIMIQTINEKEISTISTLEIAKMMGDVLHYKILEKLEGTKDGKTKGIIPTLNAHEIESVDYFIKSTYKDAKGEIRKCYECTKLGCDLLANKFTGEKGILFTARYVKKFDEMEKQIQRATSSFMIEDPILRAKMWIKEQEKAQLLLQEKVEIIEELSPLAELARKRIDRTGTVSITDLTKTYNLKRGQLTCWAKKEGYIHKSQIEVNNKGEKYFKVIGEEYKGIAIMEEGIKLVDKNIEEIRVAPCRFKKEIVTEKEVDEKTDIMSKLFSK